MSVHERLSRFIASKGWSQRQAAKAFGCSQAMVSDLCQGRRNPGLAIAHAIESSSASWTEDGEQRGPIRTEEWVTSSAADHASDERKSSSPEAAAE